MKVERTDKGVTIELDWTEAENIKDALSWDDGAFTSETSAQLHSELDEIFTTEGT